MRQGALFGKATNKCQCQWGVSEGLILAQIEMAV
jgi:hypothetical protein